MNIVFSLKENELMPKGFVFKHFKNPTRDRDVYRDIVAIIVELEVGELRSYDSRADITRGTHRTNDDWPVHREVLDEQSVADDECCTATSRGYLPQLK